MASTTVSIEGDLTYRDALAMYARSNGKTVAEIVRIAVDQHCGSDLTKFDEFLRATSGTRKRQTSKPRSTKSAQPAPDSR